LVTAPAEAYAANDPTMMKLSLLAPVACLAILNPAFAQSPAPVAPASALSAAETAAGWRTLLTDNAAPGFRGYKQPGFPAKGWTVTGGVLKSIKGGGGGDLVTSDEFGDFELVCEFRCSPKANSGIMYRVAETLDSAWQTGPEYQILEDATYGAKSTDMHSCGALYDLAPPVEGKTMKSIESGGWNEARIRLRNGIVQHYLNGVKVVECPVEGADWAARIAKSKFKDYKGFGVLPKGRLALQDHGDEVSYRNIKVRDLGAKSDGTIALWNGKDLAGWKAFVPDAEKAGVKPESVWSIEDGVLVCKGNPVGYIRTEKDHTNYVLRLQWRFSPVTKKAGNSGVLLRMIGEDKVWPRSVEAQLQSGSAGDFWNIENFVMTADPARTNGRNTKKMSKDVERPLGEWNEYEIVVDHGTITLMVNGEMLNQATKVEEVAGKICLQSEGAEIHFKNISLTPIK